MDGKRPEQFATKSFISNIALQLLSKNEILTTFQTLQRRNLLFLNVTSEEVFHFLPAAFTTRFALIVPCGVCTSHLPSDLKLSPVTGAGMYTSAPYIRAPTARAWVKE